MNDMSDDERAALLQEHINKVNDLMAFQAGDTERRRDPSIGYGTLFDEDSDQRYDYTLTIDIALPGGACIPDASILLDEIDAPVTHCVRHLEEMVEAAVKEWLTRYAPKGTSTSVVEAIEE